MPPQTNTIQDFYKQIELDKLYAGKSSSDAPSLIHGTQGERTLASMPQSGAVTPLLPTGPVDLALETLLTGMSYSKGVDPRLAILTGLAAGRYGGKIKDMAVSGARKGAGRVLTQTFPISYDVSMKSRELSKLLGTPFGIGKIIKDEPLLFTNWGEAVEEIGSQMRGREFPFRKMFGLKPRWGSEKLYKINKDGTYSFSKMDKQGEELRNYVKEDIVYGTSDNHPVMGGYSAKDKFTVKKGVPGITRSYEDRWDFDVNPGEKMGIGKTLLTEGQSLDPKTYIARYLASKVGKPITIKGKATLRARDPISLTREPDPSVMADVPIDPSGWDFNQAVLNQISDKRNIPSQKWFDSYVKTDRAGAKRLAIELEELSDRPWYMNIDRKNDVFGSLNKLEFSLRKYKDW
jgi:hypothetical protein